MSAGVGTERQGAIRISRRLPNDDERWRVATTSGEELTTYEVVCPGDPVEAGLMVVYDTTEMEQPETRAYAFASSCNAASAGYWRQRALEAEDPGEHRPYTPEVLV